MVISDIRRENLRALIQECGGNASELCRRVPRLTSAYVSQILHNSPNDRSGRPRGMGDDLARRLEQHMNKPAGWMDTLHVAETPAAYGSNVAAAPQARGAVPVISWVQAGREMPSAMWEPEPDTHVLVARKYGPGTYALRVRGDSMVDPATGQGFPDGCYIVVNPDGEVRHESYVIVRFGDTDEATFKQIIFDGPRRLLRPVNPRYPITEINGDAEIVGVVREKVLHEVLP